MTTPAPFTLTNFRIIPLLATSEVRVLRVTGYNPPSFVPTQPLFQAELLQGLPAGPPGWTSTTYDDSGWSSPVIADLDPSAALPISEYFHNAIPGRLAELHVPFTADPLWITSTPSDPDEIMLIRWWFTPPLDAAFAIAQLMLNTSSGMIGRLQIGLDDEPFGFTMFDGLVLGVRHLLTVAIPAWYRGSNGRQTITYPYRWVRIGIMMSSFGEGATYCHRPMLVSDDVRMLRVTTPPTEPSQLPTPFGGVLNPDSFGPAGWNLADFDDTAWTSAVLIDPVATTHFAPLLYTMRSQVAGLPNEPIQGDPLWDQPMPELDLAAVVLVRWHFDVPPQANPDLAQFAYLFYNTAHGQQGPVAGYLNLVANEDDPVLGDDITAGAAGIGGIVPGAQNVLAVIWGVYSNPPNDTGRFVLLDIVYQCDGELSAGESTTRGWGNNMFGKLGVGDPVNRYEPTALVFGSIGFAEVVSAHFNSWGRVDGAVHGWGDNGIGQLGIGAIDSIVRMSPVVIDDLDEVIQLAAGSGFNDEAEGARCFALRINGDLYGWGENNLAQLGTGNQNSPTAPVLVNTNVSKVSTGTRHSVVLKFDGSVYGVGDGSSGSLGLNPGAATFWQNWVRTFVPNAARVIDVLAGSVCTWALCADGTVFGCGNSQRGELGLSETTGSMQWVALPVLPDGRLVVRLGTTGRTLFMVADDGTVWALGDNTRGGLGSGSLDPDFSITPTPVLLPGGVTLTQIVQSGQNEFPSAIALGSNGQVYTWGDGEAGQMGNGTILPTNVRPIAETGLSGAEWIGGASPSFFAGVGFVAPPVVGRRGRSSAQIVG